jgi:hypothetical protein
LGRTG